MKSYLHLTYANLTIWVWERNTVHTRPKPAASLRLSAGASHVATGIDLLVTHMDQLLARPHIPRGFSALQLFYMPINTSRARASVADRWTCLETVDQKPTPF